MHGTSRCGNRYVDLFNHRETYGTSDDGRMGWGRSTSLRQAMSSALENAKRRQVTELDIVAEAIGRDARKRDKTARVLSAYRIRRGANLKGRRVALGRGLKVIGVLACIGMVASPASVLLAVKIVGTVAILVCLPVLALLAIHLLLTPCGMDRMLRGGSRKRSGIPSSIAEEGSRVTTQPAAVDDSGPAIVDTIGKHSPEDRERAEISVNELATASRICTESGNPEACARIEQILSKSQNLHAEMRRIIPVCGPDERARICAEAADSLEILAKAAGHERISAISDLRRGFDRQRRYIEASHPDDAGLTSIP